MTQDGFDRLMDEISRLEREERPAIAQAIAEARDKGDLSENAGLEGSVIVARLKSEEKGIGYNAATDQWVNMIEAGIVDPTKVTRSALQNAASVSALLLTTEAVVADKPAPVAPPMPGMDPGMGMM